MPGDAAHADDHTGVLDRVVGVVEERADAADLGPHRLADHLVEPFAMKDLKVVVEERDDAAAGVADAVVVDRRIVERRIVAEHGDPVGLDLAEVLQRRRLIEPLSMTRIS